MDIIREVPNTSIEEAKSHANNSRKDTETCDQSTKINSVISNSWWLLLLLGVSGMRTVRKLCVSSVIFFLLSLVVFSAVVFGLWRFMTTMWSKEVKQLSNAEFVLSLSGAIWFLLMVANYFVVGFWNLKGHVDIFVEYLEEHAGADSVLRTNGFRKRLRLAVIMALSVSAFNLLVYVLVNMFGGHIFQDVFIYPYSIHEISVGLFLTFMVIPLGTMVWVAPLFLIMYMCYCLIVLFKEHRKWLSERLRDDFNVGILKASRKEFCNLCKLVDIADDISGPLNGANYTLNLAMILMILYNLTYMDVKQYDENNRVAILTGTVFWTALGFCYPVIATLSGVTLNHHVHLIAQDLHDIDLSTDIGQTVKSQILLYLNRVQTEPIGLSVMYMFILDRPAIMTAIGLIATYFILLIQFGMSPSCTPGASYNACVDICVLTFNDTSVT